MLRIPAIWLLVTGLVLTRLLGLHMHACSGVESVAHVHEAPHYADFGLLFGETHKSDHPDNLEIEVAVAGPLAKHPLPSDGDQPLLAVRDYPLVAPAAGWLTVRIARGPPAAYPPHPDFFTPAPRGPPSNFVA